jgi:hypothetical protein
VPLDRKIGAKLGYGTRTEIAQKGEHIAENPAFDHSSASDSEESCDA